MVSSGNDLHQHGAIVASRGPLASSSERRIFHVNDNFTAVPTGFRLSEHLALPVVTSLRRVIAFEATSQFLRIGFALGRADDACRPKPAPNEQNDSIHLGVPFADSVYPNAED